MDQVAQETQNQVAQQTSSMSALLVIVLLVVIVLAAVIFIHNKKVNEVQKPKYGFLGKPLSAFLVMAIMLGGVGFVYYSTNIRTNEFVDVSASSDVDGSIIVTQIDSSNKIYQFNMLPTIDGLEWGGNSIYNFDVQWTIANDDVYQTIETSLNNQNTGGIKLTLKQGTYSVKANILIDDKNTEVKFMPSLEVE